MNITIDTLFLSCTIGRVKSWWSLLEFDLGVLFVFDQVFLQFWVGVDVYRSQDGLAFLTVGKSDVIFLFGLDSVFLSFSLALGGLLFLRPLFSAPFPDAQLFKVPAHGVDHPPHLSLIRTGELMHFQVFLLDEMQPIVPAGGKQMGNFLPIFASIDMKDELLSCKGMVLIERTNRLLLIFTLLEHLILKRLTLRYYKYY